MLDGCQMHTTVMTSEGYCLIYSLIVLRHHRGLGIRD